MSFTIKGTGSAYPECVKTNDDLSEIIDTSDEWIRGRTGISERRVCTHETITDLSYQSAERAMEDAGITADQIDLIICPTLRADTITPSLACVLQDKLGATCPAFDINAACSGFIYALDIAAGYFAQKKVKHVLIVASEVMSKLVDWNDRSTCVLFGDGSGAVVLSEGNDLLSIKLTSKGSHMLSIPNTEGNCPFSEHEAQPSFLHMSGQEVFKFAVNAIIDDLNDVMNDAEIKEEDVDYFLLHQANKRIIDFGKKKFTHSKDKFLTNIERFGNTSSASIPILLDEINKKGLLKKDQIIAMSAFGGGLTTGACMIRWN